MTFNVQIFDKNNYHIADNMDASAKDVLTYLNKGLVVINMLAGQPMTESDVFNTVGVSECPIELN
jgi:hypothetical protein